MRRRLKSWARTSTKLVLVVLGYFWLGAAYKLVYAQTHDLTRIKGRLPISYYQQHFLVDALIYQTWMFGPDFRRYIGELPSLAALVGGNPQAALADYCRQRELQLTALPDRYPYSLFTEEALDDAFLYSQGSSFLGVFGAREQPRLASANLTPEGVWRTTGLPDFSRSQDVARRLADDYPDSPQAPGALLRVAQLEAQTLGPAQSQETYRRLTLEYPRTEQAETAAEALFNAAMARGQLPEARLQKLRALRAAERTARERFAGKPLPAANTVTILGYRIDLSRLEIQLNHLQPAREFLDLAAREAERVGGLKGLEGDLKERLGDRKRSLERVRSELWVTDLFEQLKVGLPGPPPRPREFAVRGKVELDRGPLPGVRILLTESSPERRGFRPPTDFLQGIRYRGVSGTDGSFTVEAVPAGRYHVIAVYPTRREGQRGPVITPVDPSNHYEFPLQVTLEDALVTLPPLRFARGISTRTFGEASVSGGGIRLEWQPWPGAKSYRVEVLAGAGLARGFQRRAGAEDRDAFVRRPVLWRTEEPVQETGVTCPLLPLAPDDPNPLYVQIAQYEYVVSALDAEGWELAVSSLPLGRFHLSPAARTAMLELKPKSMGGRRRGPRGPRR